MKKTIYLILLLSITSLYANPTNCDIYNQIIVEKTIEIELLKKEIETLKKEKYERAEEQRNKMAEDYQRKLHSFDNKDRKKIDITIEEG